MERLKSRRLSTSRSAKTESWAEVASPREICVETGKDEKCVERTTRGPRDSSRGRS